MKNWLANAMQVMALDLFAVKVGYLRMYIVRMAFDSFYY